jgi:hypothetical protein
VKHPSLDRLVGAVIACFVSGVAPNAAASVTIDETHPYEVDHLELEGIAGTDEQTFHELLPRPLPAVFSGTEVVEFRRRVKNLALFDAVDVEPVTRGLRVRVRHKATISPIVDFSTGKTLADSKGTLGAVEHDIDRHATRLGGKATYGERGLNFAVWLHQHQYRPRKWAVETEVYYAGSGFRFESDAGATRWHRNRFGGELEFLSPALYGTRFRYELKLNVYREQIAAIEGPAPPNGVYLGLAQEFTYDGYTFDDLTPSGVRASVELRPGVFVGAAQARHEVRLKAKGAVKLAEYTALVAFFGSALLNTGNPNHSALLGSQQGVRGLPDAFFRNRAQAYVNVELRQGISLGKRWYVQAVGFGDAAVFDPMDAAGDVTGWERAWSTGVGARLLPTALVDTLLRVDVSRLHEPIGAWLVQFGINQYI